VELPPVAWVEASSPKGSNVAPLSTLGLRGTELPPPACN
jgi:hypothetical protein